MWSDVLGVLRDGVHRVALAVAAFVPGVLSMLLVLGFAIGYRLAIMDRALLLRSMTPLYLGWAAGFVRQVRDVDAAGVEERVERLCRAFEAAKPYLISRWRWPDRFNP